MSAAEKFVTERNRNLRVETAEKDSLEHQVTLEEINILKGATAIDEAVAKLVEENKLSKEEIEKQRFEMIEKWDKKSRATLEAIAKRVSSFDDSFELPVLDQTSMLILAQQFGAFEGGERMDWIRQARTGGNTEIALFLLRAPVTLTKIEDDTRTALTNLFKSEKEMIAAERKRDLMYRGGAVLETYETEQRRLVS